MATGIVQIGNSDDKLTQFEWHQFVKDTERIINQYTAQVHFFGGSVTWASWQNLCIIFEFDESDDQEFREALRELADAFRQDSIALTVGETRFV